MSGRGSYRGYGGYPTARGEPDCCGCFPLDCGVRTLFFLTVLGAIGTLVNIVVGAIEEQWFVFIQLLMLLPASYTLFWVLQWVQRDSYPSRYRIGEGFLWMAIVNILINVVILFVVIFAFEEFREKDADEEDFHSYYAGRYNHTGGYGGYPMPNDGYGGGYPAYNGRVPISQNYPDEPYFNSNLQTAYYANSSAA